MLIPSKGTRNLFRPKITCMLVRKMGLSMNSLRIWFGLTTASAQVVQVIKVDL